MSAVVNAMSSATLILDVALLATLAFYASRRLLDFEAPGYVDRLNGFLHRYYRELAFSLALIATSSSLYMSNVLGWAPCRLCWFQRILMYPLVLIIGIGILFDDEDVRDYAIPLALIGGSLAFYHALVQRFEQFQSAGCSITSVSCEATNISFHYGYITIPVMAFTVFLTVLILMWRFNE